MYSVYILKCADGTLYTGYTNDIASRLLKHNGETLGGAKYTKARRPVQLVYEEICKTKSIALKREIEIKGYSRAQKLKLITSL